MKEGETYAVEVFPTTGSGESYEVSLEKEIPTHLALTDKIIENIKNAPKDYVARMINIVTTRKCVPFHPEWYNLDDRIVKGGIQDEMWKAYPTIKTRDDSLATQWEKLIKISSKGPHLLLQAAPQSH
jgi:methionine aminopeptidase